ncbi:type II secretion system F family protein [Kytococcus sedentarius]|uniref:type II secretion system F family protein n=1 Tax=Kytococcus sedentarius TaxID=1276 RepID=UPI0035BBCE2A
MTGLLVGLLVAGALLLWPGRARHEVALGLARLPGQRAAAARREATVQSLRGALDADPVAAAGGGLRRVTAMVGQRVGRRRIGDEEVLRLLEGLAAALSAGLPPAAALRLVAESGTDAPWLAPVLETAGRGALLGPAWRELAEAHDSPALRHVASGWSLSERSGAALAPAVASAAETVRRARASRQTAQSAASGAMASMYMLSLLPLVGVGGAAMIGWSPRELYLEQPLGLASAVLGLLLLGVGWAGARRLVTVALRGRAVR